MPEKNTALFLDEPLINRSVRIAKQSKQLTDLVVSSDSEQIFSQISEAVQTIRRPAEYAMDTSPIHDAVNHALGEMEKPGNIYDIIVCLQNTCPLRTAEDIDRCIEGIDDEMGEYEWYGTAMTVVDADHYHPDLAYRNGIIFDGMTGLIPANEDKTNYRRQDRNTVVFMSGVVFAMRADWFRADPYVPIQPVKPIPIPWWRGMDIHTPEELRVAEILAEGLDIGRSSDER